MNSMGITEETDEQNTTGNLIKLLLLIPYLLLGIFYRFFATIDNMLSRSRELRADWLAASKYGSNALESSLTTLAKVSRHHNENADNLEINEKNNIFARYDQLLDSTSASQLDKYKEQALADIEDDFDSHPTLSTRLASLPDVYGVQEKETTIESIRNEVRDAENALSEKYQLALKQLAEYREQLQKSIAATTGKETAVGSF